MELIFFLLIVTVAINSFLILLVLIKKKDDLKNPITAIFILGVLSLIGWSIFNYLADNSSTASEALFWTRMTFPASIFVLWFILWFSYVFPMKIGNYSKKNILYFLLAMIFSVLSIDKYVVESVELDRNIGVSAVSLGIFYPEIIAFYLILIFNIVFNLYQKYKKLHGIFKIQIRYIITGWGIFFSGAIMTNLILPYLTGNANWSKFGPNFSTFMVMFTAYAIIRHRFLDIRIVIQKSIIYTLLLTITVILYTSIIFIMRNIFNTSFNAHPTVSAITTSLILALSYPGLISFFQKITDKFFFRHEYKYHEAVKEVGEIINSTIEIEKMTRKLANFFMKTIKVDNFFLIMFDPLTSVEKIFGKPSIIRHEVELVNSKKIKNLFELKNDILLDREIDYNYFRKNVYKNKNEKKLIRYAKEKMEQLNISVIAPVFFKKKIEGGIALGEKLSNKPYSGKDLELVRIVANQLSPILENINLYQKLKEHSKDLESKVEKRTQELKKLNFLQTTFVQNISHELQSPLAAIKGNIQLISKQAQEGEIKKNLRRTNLSIDRLSKLINNLLLLAKADFGQIEIKKEIIILDEFIADIYQESLIFAEDKGLSFKLDVKGKKFPISGDKDKLVSLFQNLISNAIKYTPRNKNIGINLKKERNFASITVWDEGIGISKPEINNIFDRFHRINNSEKIKGIGLGLAIAKWIVEAHHGKIEVISKEKEGSMFIVRLPLKKLK